MSAIGLDRAFTRIRSFCVMLALTTIVMALQNGPVVNASEPIFPTISSQAPVGRVGVFLGEPGISPFALTSLVGSSTWFGEQSVPCLASLTTTVRPVVSPVSTIPAYRPAAFRRAASDPQRFPLLLVNQSESDVEQTACEDDETCVPGEPVVERLCFKNDVKTAPVWLTEDLAALPTVENAVFLSAAAGGAVLLRSHVDQQVEQNIAEHGGYWGGASHWLNTAGEAVVHIPLLAGLYTYSLYSQDAELHELTLTFVASYKFTAISTIALQYATDSRHGEYGGLKMLTDSGFPSLPASTSFALAAVAEEKYGWKVGLPAYVGAGLIGWAGIDQQQHRVSDVVFGAALGYVIGKSIGALRYNPDATLKLIPFVDTTTGAQGLQVVKQF